MIDIESTYNQLLVFHTGQIGISMLSYPHNKQGYYYSQERRGRTYGKEDKSRKKFEI